MQGPPGGGKTSLARKLHACSIGSASAETEICSTDDFHYNQNGIYQFDPSRIGEFHERNLQRTKQLLDAEHSVIVDNTNIHAWEAKPYVEHAVKKGIPVIFIRVDGNFKSIHGFPQDKIDKMRSEMENLTVESCLKAVRPF